MIKAKILGTIYIVIISCAVMRSECAYSQVTSSLRIQRTDANTLTYVHPVPISLDPVFSSDSGVTQVMQDLFDGLFIYDDKGQISKAMAVDWSLDESKTIYKFNLRQDSYWSDGVRVTAHDFVTQIQRLVDPSVNRLAKPAYLAEFILNAKEIIAGNKEVSALGVKALDDFTLEVHLSGAVPFFLSVLAHPVFNPVPSHSIKKHGSAWSNQENIVTNGSYLFDSYQGRDLIRLRKNHKHKEAKKAFFEYVELRQNMSAKKVLAMFKNGEADILNGFYDYKQKWLKDTMGGSVDVHPANSVVYYKINLKLKKFQDIRVRKAMTYTLLRDQIEERLFGVLSLPIQATYSYSPPMSSLGWYGITPQWLKNNSQEELIKMAQDLMRQAGYGPDNPLTINLRYNASSINERLVSATQTMWSKIWINVVENKISKDKHYAVLGTNDFEVARSAFGGEFDDPSAYLLYFREVLKQNSIEAEGEQYHKLSDRLFTYQGKAQRKELVESLEQIILDNVYVIPIFSRRVVSLLHPNLEPVKFSYIKTIKSRHVRPKVPVSSIESPSITELVNN